MDLDEFLLAKQYAHVGETRVAYQDHGTGPPVVLLHGCPFSSFVWRNILPPLAAAGHRCLAPDLLGLGDTETPPDADWSLPAQAATVIGWLDVLGLDRVAVVGHDHGGAVAQLLAAQHPERIDRLVLSNVEAYDHWPSSDERPFITATQLPGVGRLVLWAWSRPALLRLALAAGHAVSDRSVLTAELARGYVRANLSDPHKRAKTRRFLAGQIDPANNRATLDALDGLRHFERPTMLLWGSNDPHFGPPWAQRLAADIPGVERVEVLDNAGHLLMEDQPQHVADLLTQFLTAPPAIPDPLEAGSARP
ncbi:MAG TPA: alpha/beta fold hydrolase [Acidimicrobiales bacterium]